MKNQTNNTYFLFAAGCNDALRNDDLNDAEREALTAHGKKMFRLGLAKASEDSDDDDYRQMRLRTAINTFRFRGAFGKMWLHIYVWQRDCDCCEWDEVHLIHGTFDNFLRTFDRIAEGAEGPFSVYPISRKEAEAFQQTTRDRVLEAFEDGHPWCV